MIDFNSLVDSSVEVIAEVEKIVRSKHSNSDMIVLKDIYVNGEYFRDHAWVKMTKRLMVVSIAEEEKLKKEHELKKRLDNVCFTATATIMKYYDLETNREEKLGFRSFRSVKVTAENKG